MVFYEKCWCEYISNIKYAPWNLAEFLIEFGIWLWTTGIYIKALIFYDNTPFAWSAKNRSVFSKQKFSNSRLKQVKRGTYTNGLDRNKCIIWDSPEEHSAFAGSWKIFSLVDNFFEFFAQWLAAIRNNVEVIFTSRKTLTLMLLLVKNQVQSIYLWCCYEPQSVVQIKISSAWFCFLLSYAEEEQIDSPSKM